MMERGRRKNAACKRVREVKESVMKGGRKEERKDEAEEREREE